LITTLPSLKIDIENFPAVKKHLLSFGYDRLKQTGEPGARKKTHNKWFETQDSISYWEDFYRQKIIYSETNNSKETKICFDKTGKFFIDKTCFIITAKSEIIIQHIFKSLKSKLFTWYMSLTSPLLGVNGISLTKESVQTFPIHNPNSNYHLNNEEINYIEMTL